MSWDVLYLNYHGDPPKDLRSDDDGLDVLGSAEDVHAAIARTLPDVNWSDPVWGMYMGNGFTLEFNTGNGDPVQAIMVHVRGGGDPIPTLLQVAAPNKWSLYDCSMGEFIDPEHPSGEGWEGFQAFRDKIVGKTRGPD